MAEQTKEELLGQIQRLTQKLKSDEATLKNVRKDLKEIDDGLPAKKELLELADKAASSRERLLEQRKKNEEWVMKNKQVQEAKVDVESIESSLSDTLLRYIVMNKTKSVHAYPNEPVEIDREIVTSATIGAKVAANLSLFTEDDLIE